MHNTSHEVPPKCHDLWGVCQSMEQLDSFSFASWNDHNVQQYTNSQINTLELHMNFHNCRVFMQSVFKVTQFLKSTKIQILDWPGSSPDPNPTENLCTDLKNQVFERQPTNAKVLEKAIKEVWLKVIVTEYCQSLEESMSKRLKAVIRAKGGPTKY